MAFILLRLLVLGVIAAAAGDGQITWLTPKRALVPCVVAEEGGASRRPPPPLIADERPRSRAPRRLGGDVAEVSRKRNGTEGVYQCSVRHHAGAVLGYPVHWKFASMDKLFTRHPENSTAHAGMPHALSCEVPSAPTATVSWLRNGESLPRNKRYILLSTQLVFTEVRKEDAGVYKCIATNSHLNKTRFSRSGWLRVVDPEELEPAMLPLRDEVSVIAPRFSRAQLLCPVLGWPRPKITWEITPPGSIKTAVLESTEEVLELTSLEHDLEGVYKCSVEGHSHLSKVFNVTMTEPVTITLPPVSKEVIRASTVRFNCSAVGRPAPAVTWYKDGVELEMGGRFNVRSSSSGDLYQLVVGGVTSGDAGVYQCFARNVASTASSWAELNVTGAHAAAPAALSCFPLGGAVLLRWQRPSANVMAYTVQTTLPAWPGQPHNNTEETITVSEPLTTYSFEVRAYIRATGKNVAIASDMSEAVNCQGQGVPLRITKQGEDAVLVSWKQFAQQTRGVVQWLLQHRLSPSSAVTNVTLPGAVHNYTLQVPPTQPLQVRVLGSKSEDWLPQNLTFLAWTSTGGQDDAREVTAIPEDLRVTQVLAREFTVKWRCEGAEVYAFLVCVRKPDGTKNCLDSYNNSTTVDGLEPETEYEVEVAAKAAGLAPGPPSQPLLVTTLSEGPEGFKELTCKFVNASTVRVSWSAPPAKYSVLYSSELNVPVELWDRVDTVGNTALINGVDQSKDTYVMVTGYDPLIYSPIKTIPAQAPEVQWWWTGGGVRVAWRGAGRVLRYSQNLTRSLDLWPALSVAGTSVELTNLDPSLPTYVMVAAPGPSQHNQVFNIPVRPKETSSLYLALGIALGVCVACVLGAAAVCAWRRSKAREQTRPRRRNVSTNEEDDEEAAEMKSVGGRLANGGGSRDAGEPLLNGHVHITENPQSKAPNGKMRKGVMTFDLARYEDPDATQETVLDEQACRDLLDTSRRDGDITSPPSFPKLPDDNMNSELNRSAFHLDNSRVQPTLQPNG